MKKLLAIFLAALLLSFVSVVQAAIIIDTNYTIGTGTTEWVSTTHVVDDWSLKLYWPKPGENYAGVRITGLGDPTVEVFSGWSYWANAPESYCPTFTISLDTALDNYTGRDYDTNIVIWPDNDAYADSWFEIQSSSTLPYVIWWNGGGPVMKSMTWEQFQQPFSQWGNNLDFGDAVIKQIRVSNNGIGTGQSITAYIDDFSLDGVTYAMEIPEPGTMIVWALLGAASWLGMGVWRRGRRVGRQPWSDENRTAILEIIDRA